MDVFAPDCLQGQTILITGGLGAIGQVVITHLLSHSARVFIGDIVAEDEARKLMRERGWPEARSGYYRADVTDASGARKLVEAAVAAFGRLDIALCHAGVACSRPILEVSEQEWDALLDVNLKGAFLVAQAAGRAMIRDGVRGKIVFTSSWVQDVPWPEITPYTVSKSGMKMLMRGMARELASHGIRVNGVAPGIVAVGMAKKQWDTNARFRQRAEKAIPLGFIQPPESVAEALLFLCSAASDYMTGSTILVDGGCSLYPMD